VSQKRNGENLLSTKVFATTLILTMARPTLKPGEAKDTYVRVRVTKAERAKIKRRWRASDSKEKTEAAWMRKQLLGAD
jgi:hypothetical protein